jgi:hypothetical protein
MFMPAHTPYTIAKTRLQASRILDNSSTAFVHTGLLLPTLTS